MTTNETEAREALERIHTNLAGAYGYKLTEEDLTDFESIKAAIASRDSEKQRADLAEARIEDLEQALNIAKRAILKAAQDTLWCDDSAAETVVDRINAALDPDKTGDLFNTEQELERLRESGQWQPIEGWHEDMGNVALHQKSGPCSADATWRMEDRNYGHEIYPRQCGASRAFYCRLVGKWYTSGTGKNWYRLIKLNNIG